MAFKMKEGSPFQRNFGIGSPIKQDKGGKVTKTVKKQEDKKMARMQSSTTKPTLLEKTSVYMDNTATGGGIENRKGHRDFGKPARSNWADIADHVNKKYPNLKSEVGTTMPKGMRSGEKMSMTTDEYRKKNKLPRVYSLKKHPRSGTYSEKGK